MQETVVGVLSQTLNNHDFSLTVIKTLFTLGVKMRFGDPSTSGQAETHRAQLLCQSVPDKRQICLHGLAEKTKMFQTLIYKC